MSDDPRRLLIAKIGQGFDQLDADGDGILDEDDHALMGRRAAQACGHGPGSPAERRLVGMYLRIWRDVHFPYLRAGEKGITRERFVDAMTALAEHPTRARAVFGELAEAFLEIADVDGNGRISRREFHAFQSAHFPGVTRARTDVAFGHLDTDDDGYLYPAEFVRAIVEYWTSTDPDAPGNWWAGQRPY